MHRLWRNGGSNAHTPALGLVSSKYLLKALKIGWANSLQDSEVRGVVSLTRYLRHIALRSFILPCSVHKNFPDLYFQEKQSRALFLLFFVRLVSTASSLWEMEIPAVVGRCVFPRCAHHNMTRARAICTARDTCGAVVSGFTPMKSTLSSLLIREYRNS